MRAKTHLISPNKAEIYTHTQDLVLGGLCRVNRAESCLMRLLVRLLLACLHADLLLSFSSDIPTGALGVAAIAFTSRMVLVATDEGAAVLQAWFNSPPPATEK